MINGYRDVDADAGCDCALVVFVFATTAIYDNM